MLDILFLRLRRLHFDLEKLQYLFIGISGFFLMYPSFVWEHINLNTYFFFTLLLIALFIEIIYKRAYIVSPPLPAILLVFYIFYINIVGESTGGKILDTRLIVSFIFLLFSKETIYKAYYVFVYAFGGLLILSLLFYFLYIFGVYLPEFKSVIGTDGREYYNYPFNTMLSYMKRPGTFPLSFYRFSAFVGEPGWIGTRAALILFSLKFDFKRFKILYIYLIAVIMSFSLGGFIPLFIGVGYYFFTRKIKIKLKHILLFGVIVLSINSFNIDFFDRYIFSRLTIVEGGLAGDNRTKIHFEEKWKTFVKTPEVIIGKGKGQSSEGGAGWKTLVYERGFFGLILYLSIFIAIFLFIWKRGQREYAILFLFVFLLTIYHRTRLHQIYYLFILYGGLLYNENTSSLTKNYQQCITKN